MKTINKKTNNILFYILIFLLSICLIILSVLVSYGKTDLFDQNILIWISGIRNPFLTRLMIFISEFCNTMFLIVVTLFILLLVKNYETKILAVINSLGVFLLNSFLKIIFARIRPEFFMLIEEKTFSFPSGHAVISTTFYGIIAYFCYKEIKHKYWKYITSSLLLILILLISFSRLYLGVHYLTDIMTGFMIGVIIILIEIRQINKRK